VAALDSPDTQSVTETLIPTNYLLYCRPDIPVVG